MSAQLLAVEAKLLGVQQLLNVETKQASLYKKALDNYDKLIEEYEGAIRLAQACVDSQTDLKEHIEVAMTSIIQAVFDDRYVFKFEPVIEAKTGIMKGLVPTIYKDGEPFNVKLGGGGSGGGMQGVTGMSWDVLTQGVHETAPFICFDEPATYLEKVRWPPLISIIKEYAKQSGMQIFIITNEPIDGFDEVIYVTMPGSHSVVEVR